MSDVRRRLARLLVALVAVTALLVAGPTGAIACSGPPRVFAEIVRTADWIGIVEVEGRTGDGPWTYTTRVVRTLKGGPLPNPWVIEDAGSNECGMPRLDVGERYVLEYHEPDTVVAGPPSFLAWKIGPGGTVRYSWYVDPPVPQTVEELVRAYRLAGLPDTATAPGASPAAPLGGPRVFIMAAGLLAAAATTAWAFRRRPASA